jgi:hypothetical protein
MQCLVGASEKNGAIIVELSQALSQRCRQEDLWEDRAVSSNHRNAKPTHQLG